PLAANSRDLDAMVARAALFEKYKLSQDALEQYEKIESLYPGTAWVRNRLFVHGEEQKAVSQRPAPATLGGKTYALLVGVSSYSRPGINPLQFAHEDALLFENH